MLAIEIVGNHGHVAKVTHSGELVVAPVLPNESKHQTMAIIDTAYSFASPVSGKKMRLENILIYANKGVGTNDATVIIYTANSLTSLIAIDTILEIELPKYSSRDLIGLNLQLPEGIFLNAKTNDNTIFMTMMGYYLEA